MIRINHDSISGFLRNFNFTDGVKFGESYSSNHLAIIKQGRVIAQGETSRLLRRGGTLQLKVTDTDKAVIILKSAEWIPSVTREDNTILVEVPLERAADISALLAKNNIFLSEMKTRENTLESFFLEVTES